MLCGRRSRGSGSPPFTPVRSRARAASSGGETPSVDGHFDRISTAIDPAFGTEDEFRTLCDVADAHGGSVIDDIVPGHTGKAPTSGWPRWGTRTIRASTMVEIPPEDWALLPEVPEGEDSGESRPGC
jgi:hypothetical protein